MDACLIGDSSLRVLPLAAVPVLYAVAALLPGRDAAKGNFTLQHGAALAAWLCACLGALGNLPCDAVTWSGIALVDLGRLGAVRFSLRGDVLSSVMLLLVTFLGWVNLRYSWRYLAGEPGLPRYIRWLHATLAAVSLLVISNNLAILLCSWIAVSLCLHRLLTFYGDRPQALRTAQKKFVLSRLAELLFAVSLALIASSLGSLEIDRMLDQAGQLANVPSALQAAAILIVLSVVLKSAQLPVHGWLIQVMEAPTPVSALLHAGVVNLGGFVLLRLATLVAVSAPANAILLVLGSTTAVLAALVTLTRSSIKVMLAWSTCAQLGFMLVECGLGAYDLALLHLLAHSLYKAHAFLNAGSTVEAWRLRQLRPQPPSPSLVAWLLVGVAGIALVGGAALIASPTGSLSAARALPIALFGLALAPLLSAAVWRGWRHGLGLAGAVFALALLQHHVGSLVGPWTGVGTARIAAPAWAIAWAGMGFLVLFCVQGMLLAWPDSGSGRAFTWFYGGLFLDEWVTGCAFRFARWLRVGIENHRVDSTSVGRKQRSRTPANRVELSHAIEEASRFIAPTWPLDQLIAVNPFHGLGDRSFSQAAAELQLLVGGRLCMPRVYYRSAWLNGSLRREHLHAAIAAHPSAWTVDQLIACLDQSSNPAPRLQLICDLIDERNARAAQQRPMTWGEYITQSISQFCAAWFDAGQATWQIDRQHGMYRTWLRHTRSDRGPRWLMGMSRVADDLCRLPDDPQALIAFVAQELAIPRRAYRSYFAALLLRISGWAAWCAHERFEARKRGDDDDQIRDLLAIRLAWEWLLSREQPFDGAQLIDFHAQWLRHDDLLAQNRSAQQPDLLLQYALERAYQDPLCHDLAATLAVPTLAPRLPPTIQAVFCIDVRSEPLRRSLESACPTIQTIGFAGFFGLPIRYTALGALRSEPRLPGLLLPRLQVEESCAHPADTDRLAKVRQWRIALGQQWHALRTLGSSAFAVVETCGIFYAVKLLAQSRVRAAPALHPAQASQRLPAPRPRLNSDGDRVALAEQILVSLGGAKDLGRLVLLCGHGSSGTNNPQAAALQCGACGGHRGDINARVLADLLNTPAIRSGLALRGQPIPEHTWFVAGLHDTTTDDVELFDLDQTPSSHASDLAQLCAALKQAGALNRARRAATLDLPERDEPTLRQRFHARAQDWAEVRPEWGLVGNSCLIVAPRQRTRALDLAGRVFLHEYDCTRDDLLRKLEQILTAPMLVAHWINLQYYASVVDPLRYGSGNKVLHNVVGGRLGVFEGNGGDLRIGLSLQSVQDGRTLRHTPVRLSVFVEAPQAALDAVIDRCPQVADLVRHEWLHLFQIDAAQRHVARYQGGRWQIVSRPPGSLSVLPAASEPVLVSAVVASGSAAESHRQATPRCDRQAG